MKSIGYGGITKSKAEIIYQFIEKFLSAEITFDLDHGRGLSVCYVNWEDQKLLGEGAYN